MKRTMKEAPKLHQMTREEQKKKKKKKKKKKNSTTMTLKTAKN